ncbi:MAG: DNA-3-methyladenine glycosylase [Bryobacteraceae bacterium]
MRKAIHHLKKADPVLAAIIERCGPYKVQYREPIFQTLVRSIIYQQLSGKAALTIFNRVKDAANEDPLTPESMLKMRPQKMRTLGLSKQKIEYIRELARKTRDGEIVFERLRELDDAEIIAQLTQARGVGVWTVQMFLIFALKRLDVLPVADLGVRSAMKRAYGMEELPNPAEMQKIAEPWRPYATVASWYLWRSLDNEGAM